MQTVFFSFPFLLLSSSTLLSSLVSCALRLVQCPVPFLSRPPVFSSSCLPVSLTALSLSLTLSFFLSLSLIGSLRNRRNMLLEDETFKREWTGATHMCHSCPKVGWPKAKSNIFARVARRIGSHACCNHGQHSKRTGKGHEVSSGREHRLMTIRIAKTCFKAAPPHLKATPVMIGTIDGHWTGRK